MTTAPARHKQINHRLLRNFLGSLFITLMVVAWIWLYRPTLQYLHTIFSIEDFRTNQILLIGIMGLIVYRSAERWQTGQPIRLRLSTSLLPLLLTVVCTLAWLTAERWLGLNTVSATLFGLGSYGLLGLFIQPERWRRGFPAAFLIIGTLPFNAHIETFLGYPLRIFTAQLVGDGLAAAGYASIGVDTILIFENGISKIDLPCSGIQSLWAGTLFFLAATWLEEKKLGGRWLLALITFALVLLAANSLRVAILVTVGEALGYHFAAEMLHIPLGVLGFVAACAVALAMMRHVVPILNRETQPPAQQAHRLDQPFRLLNAKSLLPSIPIVSRYAFLTVFFVLAGFLYAAKPITGLSTGVSPMLFPAELELIHEPLKPDEEAWLIQDGADSAERYRFTWQSDAGARTGTMILISSRTWRAHHKPERCFEVYGLDVNDSGTHLVTPSMPIRQVNLAVPTGEQSYRAVYWFQSADTITDDYGSRLWADVTQPSTRWMLVSVLFDENYPADDAGTESFYLAMQSAVGTNLE